LVKAPEWTAAHEEKVMYPKSLTVAAVALIGVAASALPGFAAPGDDQQPPPPRHMPLRAAIMFNLIDRNGDGAIDKDELNVVRDAIFAALDANGDGKLTKDELQGAMPLLGGDGRPGPGHDMRGPQQGPRHWGRMGRWDHQRPGVNRMGFDGPEASTQPFASLDKNGDGAVSQDEFATGSMPQVPGPTAE
jgi:hypothetical protein